MAFELSPTDPMVVFTAVAALIFLGFLGNLVFSRLRFNDTLLLIAVGVVLGPLLAVVDPGSMQQISSLVGPLALILILFDGGLALRLKEIVSGLGSAAVLGIVGFVLTAAGVGAVVATTLYNDPSVPFSDRFLTGLILGSILGGTSALVVLPSLQHIKCQKKTATTLSLESALTDILVVVVTFTLISIAAAQAGDADGAGGAGGIDAQGVTSKLVITFAMSLFLGGLAGVLWLLAVPSVREKPFGYMLSLGVMFALYVLTEWLLRDVSSGGGPLAVLAFGIVLGNAGSMGRIGRRIGEDFGTGIKRFQGEISFLVRTFFFIYLGVLVDPAIFGDLHVWGVGLLVFAAMLAARYVAVVLVRRHVRLRGDDLVLFTMMPRGLAAAVLAAIPFQQGVAGSEKFVGIAFLMLVFTNLLSTFGALVLEKRLGKGAGADEEMVRRAPLSEKKGRAGKAKART